MDLSNQENSFESEPAFLVDIIIKEGVIKQLKLHKTDNVKDRCIKFCHDHGIEPHLQSYLIKMVEDQIALIKTSMQAE